MRRKSYKRMNMILSLRKVDRYQTRYINCVRFHPTATIKHERKKFEICFKLYKKNHPFITEAWTTDKKRRYDILDLEDNIIYEIETGNSSLKKDDSVVIGA